MKYREEADYNPSYVFTEEDYKSFRNDAEEVRRKIGVYLTAKGYYAGSG